MKAVRRAWQVLWVPMHPVQLVLGWAVWALYFVAMYASLSVTCAVRPGWAEAGATSGLNLTLLALTVLVAAGLMFWGRRCWQEAQAAGSGEVPASAVFVARVAACVHLMAAFAVLAIGLPAALLPACL